MKFGLFIPQGWKHDLVGIDPADEWQTMLDLARAADASPAFESLWVFDHFHTVPVPSETESTHEAWTLMAAFAASTERIRLGQMCTCMAYRNPGYLAKVAASVDHVSRGRLEMGIGAGWYEHEWRAYGYGFPPAKERLGRLREGVEIFRQAWTTGTATLDGDYYRLDGAIFRPLPVQETSARNRIPMWIAGGGEKVTLKIAADYADYTNFAGDPETFQHKSDLLRGHCETVGRDFDEITRSSNYTVFTGATEADVADKLRWFEDHMVRAVGEKKGKEHAAQQAAGYLVGTPEQLVEKLRAVERLGMTYAITQFPDSAYDRSSVELFEKEVVPALA